MTDQRDAVRYGKCIVLAMAMVSCFLLFIIICQKTFN